MIRVTVKKLKERKGDDIFMIRPANLIAERMADLIKERVKNFKCEDHNPARLNIIISADINKMISIRKAGACCKKFSDSVKTD